MFFVRAEGQDAVLKLLTPQGREDEAGGAAALGCFDGAGAVRLLRHETDAQLLEWVDGPSLTRWVEEGRDAEATEVLAELLRELRGAVMRSRRRSGARPTGLLPLPARFRALFERARSVQATPLDQAAATIAEELFEESMPQVPLHGDLHHGNVLRCSKRGWLAIDPKGLLGDADFDAANLFYNPAGHPGLTMDPERLAAMAETLASVLGSSPRRLLRWGLAYGALSACWSQLDGQDPGPTLATAAVIQGMLSQF